MKKIFLIGVLLMGSVFISKAQSSSDVGKALNIYVSPTFSGGIGGMINGEFEIPMFVDNLTIAPYVGVGVTSYSVWVDNNSFLGGHYTQKPILLLNAGVVAHYYFDWLIPNMPDKYDVFAKVKTAARLRIGNDNYTYNNPFIPVYFSAKVGGRVNFSPSVSLYGAAGYGHSSVDVGLTFKM